MSRTTATLIGFTAVLMWAVLAALTAASGTVPPFQLAAMAFLIGGLIGLATWPFRPGIISTLPTDWRVWALGVGGLFGYHFVYFTAIRSAMEGESLSRQGQAVLDRLAALKVPTVAAIHGSCMGGGMETVLACTYRIASDHPKTSIGLPEVNLGIIPGLGGTQRLPRLVGLRTALDLILTGRALKATRALKKRDQTRAERLRRTRDALFPGGALQERGLGLVGPLARHGPALVDVVREAMDPWASGHQVVFL